MKGSVNVLLEQNESSSSVDISSHGRRAPYWF